MVVSSAVNASVPVFGHTGILRPIEDWNRPIREYCCDGAVRRGSADSDTGDPHDPVGVRSVDRGVPSPDEFEN